MKGIIFTEFIEMVENQYGFATANTLIDRSNLASEGIYSSIGNYSANDFVKMTETLAELTDSNAASVSVDYGTYLFDRFYEMYPKFFEKIHSPFEVLRVVDSHIHKEVHKLYPDAELPKFTPNQVDDCTMRLIYDSSRNMHDFAYGLILGCLKHFGEDGLIEMSELDDSRVLFTIRLLSDGGT